MCGVHSGHHPCNNDKSNAASEKTNCQSIDELYVNNSTTLVPVVSIMRILIIAKATNAPLLNVRWETLLFMRNVRWIACNVKNPRSRLVTPSIMIRIPATTFDPDGSRRTIEAANVRVT